MLSYTSEPLEHVISAADYLLNDFSEIFYIQLQLMQQLLRGLWSHGPALAVGNLSDIFSMKQTEPLCPHIEDRMSSFDVVLCISSLVWPTQAANWPSRRRNCGWPDAEAISSIVNRWLRLSPGGT
jgi:hypothetical protein